MIHISLSCLSCCRSAEVWAVKINLRVLFQQDARPALQETGEFSAEELASSPIDLDAQSERLAIFLDATKDASGSWFNPIMIYTKKELDRFEFFQIECRKTVEENNRDYKWNEAHVTTLDLVETCAGMQVYLPNRLAVSTVSSLKPHMVACVGQWLREFVVHSGVAAAFAAESLSGYSLRPLFHSKSEAAHADVHQLYSDKLMPAAELGHTTLGQ